MADIRIAKTALKSAVGPASPGGAKIRPSTFDQIQTKIAEKVAADLKVPPMAQPDARRTAAVENDLRTRLSTTNAKTPGEFLQPDIDQNRKALDKLSDAVNRLPAKSAFDPIRTRLNQIEQQFQRSSNLIRRGGEMDPKSLLSTQMQLYQVSENVELLSKVVDQVASGMKTIMQTQV